MRIAIIDLGTNSVRFDVHQLDHRGGLKTLHREKIMVRLGQGVFTQGQLDRNAIHRTIHAFSGFRRICKDLKVRRVVALATSALREATDSKKFVTSVLKATGIHVRVIPGIEEARLIAVGVLSNQPVKKSVHVGLIDIGGGSTEISICKNKKVLKAESFPLGTARLQQVFLKSSPPAKEDVRRLKEYIFNLVAEKATREKWPKPQGMIGSSGTIRAVGKLLRKSFKSKDIGIGDLSKLVKEMSRMNTTALLGMPGMESKRVDMILAGAILLEQSMLAVRAKKVTPTEFSLRDGILEEQMKLARNQMTTEIALHLSEIFEKAERFGIPPLLVANGVRIADGLFERLKGLHKLDRDWKIYLIAAMVLRNTGEAVSIVGHAEHSYYIVKNAQFPFIEEWESELVALLCRGHEKGKADPNDLIFFKKEPLRQKAFQKLTALLSIADALDPADEAARVKIKRIAIQGRRVTIKFTSSSPAGVEALKLEKRIGEFEKVFRCRLEIVRA